MEDGDVKRAFLCLVHKQAMFGVFSPGAAMLMGATPVIDIFGRVIPITHASTRLDALGMVAVDGDEIVGLVDKESVDRLAYSIAIITPASTVYRGFVHFHTVQTVKCDYA